MVAMRRQRGERRAARLGQAAAAGGRLDDPASSSGSEQQSLYSFRTIVVFTVIFLSVILLILIVPKFLDSMEKYNWNASAAAKSIRDDQDVLTSYSGLIFHDPADLPLRLIRQLDVVLVLGGGRPMSLTEPPLYVQRRCDDAAIIVRMHQQQQQQQQQESEEATSASAATTTTTTTTAAPTTTLPILCLSAGTAHVAQLLSADGLPIWESTACAAYLAKHYNDDHGDDGDQKKIHNLKVHVETTSYDTIGNAFYARTNHVDLHRHDPNNKPWRNLLIVTNDFHLNRSKAIFDWIFSLPTTTTTTTTSPSGGKSKKTKRKKKSKSYKNMIDHDSGSYRLFYLASPDVGLSDAAVQARLEKEAASLKSVQALSLQYHDSLSSVYHFLTQHHDLYTASKLVKSAAEKSLSTKNVVVSDLVRQSYGGGGGGDGNGARWLKWFTR